MPSSAVATRPPTHVATHTIVLFTMCLGVFIAQLDSTVVYLAAKHIGAELQAGVSQLQWVLDAYNLVYACLLLTGGTLSDLYGRVRIFVIGLAVIGAGSLVCAVAPNAGVLIAGRAITGLGAALELSASLAILTVAFPDTAARGYAIGIWASCNGLAMAIGPTIGGFLVDTAGWRSIFYVVIPFCALGMLTAWSWVPELNDPRDRRLDPIGQTLAIGALATLAFVAIEGPHWGWMSPAILALAAVCIASTVVFLRVQARTGGALVPLELFSNATFDAALAIAGLMTFGIYAMLFLVPLYLQSITGASALVAAVELVPMSVTFVIVSQFSGPLTKRIGARAMMACGMAAMGIGLLILAAVLDERNLIVIEAALIVVGVGLGLNTGPVNAVAVAAVTAGRSGTASGLVNTARMIGATLGIAILGAIYATVSQRGDPNHMVSGLRLAFLGGALAELSGVIFALVFTRADSNERAAHARA